TRRRRSSPTARRTWWRSPAPCSTIRTGAGMRRRHSGPRSRGRANTSAPPRSCGLERPTARSSGETIERKYPQPEGSPARSGPAAPWCLASVVIHLFYFAALIESYRAGDMGQVYPLARGAAPLMTAAATTFILGERLSTAAWCGIGFLGGGVLWLSVGGVSKR